MPMIYFRLILVAFFAVLGGSAEAQDEVIVTIGVRSDAAPFSYLVNDRSEFRQEVSVSGTLSSNGYAGYVVQICDAALNELISIWGRERPLQIIAVNVDASTRFEKLKDGSIDVLCDPATITDDRLKVAQASIPIYLSGISYAYPSDFPDHGALCDPLIGVVSDTTSELTGVSEILRNGEWPRVSKRVSQYLTVLEPLPPEDGSNCSEIAVDTIITAETHDVLARMLCAGKIFYYVGDVEIIRRKLQDLENTGCAYKISRETFSDERYTIFIGNATDDPIKNYVLLKFREILSRQILRSDSTLLMSYENYFGKYRASRKLQAFYWSLIGRHP